MKNTWSILLAESRDGINEGELLHDKRRNLSVSEKHQVDFIRIEL
jgi:hypothetical protein